ncbi:hypothetical protein ADIWIN_0682 [Winogradskyella psychrotolerans RS-3]|uniref:DUF2383 domain-containing protein n=1 Tax=Winogradskyella psychrotolerans RS-3 TaxID=641526 RepID=S7VVQ2_9FLAO|nr:hypothetical protein ADIWIN_0682 [Winogradskyella psychrotolerans RS-3]
MATYTEEVGNKLNGLLEKNYDAEKGYTKAAENTKHAGLRTFLIVKHWKEKLLVTILSQRLELLVKM